MKPQLVGAGGRALGAGRADTVDWPRLGQAALERDVLGAPGPQAHPPPGRAGGPPRGRRPAVRSRLPAGRGARRRPAHPRRAGPPGRAPGGFPPQPACRPSLPAGRRRHGGRSSGHCERRPGCARPAACPRPRGALPPGPGCRRLCRHPRRAPRTSSRSCIPAAASTSRSTMRPRPWPAIAWRPCWPPRTARSIPRPKRGILDTVLRRFPMRRGTGPGAAPLEFAPGQIAALALGLRKRLLVVSGGPGTGKTTLVANLLRALVRLPGPDGRPAAPLRIRLAAPTGRAAQRLTESLRAGLASIARRIPPRRAASGAGRSGPAKRPWTPGRLDGRDPPSPAPLPALARRILPPEGPPRPRRPRGGGRGEHDGHLRPGPPAGRLGGRGRPGAARRHGPIALGGSRRGARRPDARTRRPRPRGRVRSPPTARSRPPWRATWSCSNAATARAQVSWK